MRNALMLSVHIDARMHTVQIHKTRWASQVNSFMKEKRYNDPRHFNQSYELWRCPGGFDFLEFHDGIIIRNGGVRYGHRCILTIFLDNDVYIVQLYM